MPQTPNTYVTELMPRIIGHSREYLRRKTGWLPVLNHDFSDAAGKVGQRVQVPVPVTMGTLALSAGQLPPSSTGKDFGVVELVLDQAQQSEMFAVEQVHLQNYAIAGPNSVLQQQINAAIDGVIGDISTDLFSKYKEIPSFAGTGNVACFANTIDSLADVHYALNKQRVPEDRPKYGILSFEDFADLQKINEVRQAYSIGTPEVIQNNNWPSILGFGLKTDYFVPTHTAGNWAVGANVSANGTAGDMTITANSVLTASNIKAGDIFTANVSGTFYQYSVQDDVNIAGNATGIIKIDRPLDANIVAGDDLALATNFDSGRTNIFGDMMGVSVVTRVPENPVGMAEFPVKLQGEHYPITDPVSGVTVLLSFFGQFFQRQMCVSLIFGTKITHAQRLVRLLSK